jgi:hypothetical protein
MSSARREYRLACRFDCLAAFHGFLSMPNGRERIRLPSRYASPERP